MKLVLIDEKRARIDKRFVVNVFAGIENPRDVNGDGYPVDLSAVMSKSLYQIPTPAGVESDSVFIADFEAGHFIVEQLGIIDKFRGIPIRCLPLEGKPPS